MSKKIVLTGGGTAGHVTPNIALIPELKERGYEIEYIGSKKGIEKEMIEKEGIPYHIVSAGKLRRYLSAENIADAFRVAKGLADSLKVLRQIRPDVVFSKGGFVTVPVVRAAHMLHIPVIIHESDMTPGLANKLCFSAADKVCCNFPETMKYLPESKAVLTGSPIRRELFTGSREAALAFTGLSGQKPIILVMGGSLGAAAVNEAVRNILPELLKDFEVIHLCGQGKLDESLAGTEGYVQFEFVSEQMRDLLNGADLIISRAGANAICEILALRKPNILIPLPAEASRGDQILNAKSFKEQGFSYMLEEKHITDERLLTIIREVYKRKDSYIAAMKESSQSDAITMIADMADELVAE